MCEAITHGYGNPALCAQEEAIDNPLGLCYYHEKMRLGHLEPLVEGVSVKTGTGISVFSKTRQAKSK